MDWYYAVGTERKGPVTEADFEGLIQQGVVNAETLVWREGMAQWEAYGSVSSGAGGVAAATMPPQITTQCEECQRPFAADDLVQINGRTYCAECKPLALQRLREGVVPMGSDDEAVRKAHLNHEASIKSVGTLYLIGAVFCVIAFAGMVIAGTQTRAGSQPAMMLPLAFFYLVMGLLAGWTSFGLRKLKRSARIVAAVLAGIGLLNIPIGTIINGYILYLLLSAKGKTVFSEEYKRVIEATPHIKYRTSILVWIILIVIVVLLVAIAIPAIIRK